jgi:hypothetical protein
MTEQKTFEHRYNDPGSNTEFVITATRELNRREQLEAIKLRPQVIDKFPGGRRIAYIKLPADWKMPGA